MEIIVTIAIVINIIRCLDAKNWWNNIKSESNISRIKKSKFKKQHQLNY